MVKNPLMQPRDEVKCSKLEFLFRFSVNFVFFLFLKARTNIIKLLEEAAERERKLLNLIDGNVDANNFFSIYGEFLLINNLAREDELKFSVEALLS